ncbi:hybrid sensor histidine kinase/response regulator [Salipiger mucosus]|uniref:Chemotaxis protein CheA n=1 Tax=Salipiger mucosus DSM 16094 TaxID=1123237 RepID=S9Q9C2_9RHOB|nr:hybrid sensor histidine kinase/response regulator [Salipiger mucosus]EPX77976.1 Signal transduction histidine kinase CheA [Salipiger mucosus DSM 16094]
MSDELLQDFINETLESLSELDVHLIDLESDPNNPDLLDKIFRVLHTIKGTAGFLNLKTLGRIAHAAEGLLDCYRDGAPVDADGITVILAALDAIKDTINEIDPETGREPDEDQKILLDLIRDVAEAAKEAPREGDQSAIELPCEDDAVEEQSSETAEEEDAPATVSESTQAASPAGEGASPALARAPEPQGPKSVRIGVERLDNLMDLVGELVLVRNHIQQIARSVSDRALNTPVQNLSQIASELQDSVMQTRMQPVGNAFKAYHRTVRDLSKELDKQINLELVGEETEIDRQVLELIRDPLTHMVRNCADHALENTEERLEAGKPKRGTIRLEACHEGGFIIIRIEDDGRGINVDQVRKKALERGIVTKDQISAMSDNRLRSLIFEPGFSTSEAVSAVSGRGVGMDVVKTNIEKLGGTITVDSEEGVGTVFSIKIPLTLAIISAFSVSVGDEVFAIPQLNIVEIMDHSHASPSYALETINGEKFLRLRGSVYPLIDMASAFGIEGNGATTVLVCQVGSEIFGILVDRVLDTEEIVVKPLSKALKDVKVYSGNTILGDGRVIMIIDPNGLFSTFDIPAKVSDEEGDEPVEVENDILQVVLFRAGGHMPRAVHLSVVARISQIETANIHRVSDGRLMVQNGDSVLPLVCPVGYSPDWERCEQKVIIFEDEDSSMGMLVDEILDVVETDVVIDISSDTNGIIGTAVINSTATEIVDVSHYLDEAVHNWFNGEQRYRVREEVRVLIVDDSQFFRNILFSMLASRGYEVKVACGPEEALDMMSRNEFDVLVSDIEMPRMTGLDLIRRIRNEGPQSNIRAVAISSHGLDEDRAAGLEAGFDAYLSKTDRASIFEFLLGSDEKRIREDA